jgi:hypothetical protein
MAAAGASSLATGVLAICAVSIALLAGYLAIGKEVAFQRRSLALVAGVLSVFALHSLFAAFTNHELDLARFIPSVLVFSVYVCGAGSLLLILERLPCIVFDRAVLLTFGALVFAGFCGVVKFSPFLGRLSLKSVLFFLEPSHFALSLFPFLAYGCVVTQGWKRWMWILVGVGFGLGLQNLTLIIGVALMVVLLFPLKRILLIVPVLLILVGFLDLRYFVQRVDFSSSSLNLSQLVYLQGWERAWLNSTETWGVGLGFQQFGLSGSKGLIQEQLAKLNSPDLNLLDGGSVGSKLIGEFGVLGLGLLVLFLSKAAELSSTVRKMARAAVPLDERLPLFLNLCFIFYFLDLFVRGVGYFSPSGFFFLAAVLSFATGQKKNPKSLGSR